VPLVRWLWGLNILHPFQQYRRERVGWNPGTNYRSPTTLHNFFVFLGSIIICRLSKLTLSDQARVTATERQSFRFSVKTCSRSAPVGGFEKVYFSFPFSPRPEPAVSGPTSLIQNKNLIQYITSVLWGTDVSRTQSGQCVLVYVGQDTIVSDISEFCSMSTHRISLECSVAREEAGRSGY